MITNVTIVHKSKQNLHENLLTDIFYLFLSLSNQIPSTNKAAAAIALSQRGISISAATTLIFRKKRHNWAQAKEVKYRSPMMQVVS